MASNTNTILVLVLVTLFITDFMTANTVAKSRCLFMIYNTLIATITFPIAVHFNFLYLLGLSVGNKITSLIEDVLVNSIINRSIPIPNPMAGGMPCSNAST